MRMIGRVAASVLGFVLAASVDDVLANVEAFPVKPIRLIIASAPQGGTDTTGRIIATALTESLGQQVIPENRAGAGGQIATGFVAKAPPDGYTLLISAGQSLVVHPHTYLKLPYDVARDFAPISLAGASDYACAVHPSLPVRTVKDLVALARAKPGQILFSSSGNSSIPHLGGELFKLIAKVDMLHVPYKGGGPAAIAILSGEVSLMLGSLPTVIPHANTGKLRLIATASEKRSKALPDLPTVNETLPGIVVTAWYAMLAPAGTTKEIVGKLNAEIVKAVRSPKVSQILVNSGSEPVTTTPEELRAFLTAETAKWGQVVKAAGLKRE